MSMAFRRSAFEPWVRDFVDWSNGESGIRRPPTEAEVAAHRGLFALDRVQVPNVRMFVRHVVGTGALEPATSLDLATLLADLSPLEADVEDWFVRFRERRPLPAGNGRCGRALRMWHRLRGGGAFAAAAQGGPVPLPGALLDGPRGEPGLFN